MLYIVAKVYLETSFISACVTTRDDVASAYRREASLAWWDWRPRRYEVCISDEVVNELSDPRYPQGKTALRCVERVPIISVTEKMVALAQGFVDRQVMPKQVGGDALHVAMATVARVDYMLTWNVKHLANPNKAQLLNAVCLDFGLVPPRILRPDDMMELADESS